MLTLPAVGSPVEKLRVDCKVGYFKPDLDERRQEMAKDVAAFANAQGGRLLIGSKEVGGLLKEHIGLTVA